MNIATATTKGRGCTIPELHAERALIWASRNGLPDKLFDAAVHIADELEFTILETPCTGIRDLRLKLEAWDRLIEDPACILDKHVDVWSRLKADIGRVIDQEIMQSAASFARVV